MPIWSICINILKYGFVGARCRVKYLFDNFISSSIKREINEGV